MNKYKIHYKKKIFFKNIKSNENLKIDLFRTIFDLFYNEDKLISFSKNKSYIPKTYYYLLESFSLRDIKIIINGIDKIDFFDFKDEVMKNSKSSIDDLVDRNKKLPNSNDLLTKDIIYEKLEILWEFIKDQAKNNKYYLRIFLEFMTGSNSLPVGGYESYKYPLKFNIYYDSNGATEKKAPNSHTCENSIDIHLRTFFDEAEDNKKELWKKFYGYEFLKSLNEGEMGNAG